ncbi:peptidylprolyl isomerase [Bythopirellula polymerisocia]|uniref:Peptidylprolyl isomerase n=1 Tax=Bythopirellula polymerisocia TaxID=2528003 RepID=A0A5C6D1K6_9BACT|nr:peptidylprolyl isomerase [Bythopirellula polymerisocia]TWU29714.1 peptidylprolyl isomerase [Bythopirellula polymerisocia]
MRIRLCGWLTIVGALMCAMIECAVGQPAFGPPPVPQGSPSAVRGIYDPSQTNGSPAQVVAPPQMQTQPAKTQAVTNGKPADLATAKPLEGGQIVARIDGQVVLASDVLWVVNMILESNGDRIPPEQREAAAMAIMRQQVIGLIDTKVLYADFRRKVPAENLPKVEENLNEPFDEMEIPRLIQMLEVADRRELEEVLHQRGTSLTDLRRAFYERTIAGEWLRQLAPKPKPVTHEQMLAYYQAHEAEYDYPSQATWEELMIRFDEVGNDRAVAWRTITEMGNEVWQRVLQNPQVRGPVMTEIAKAKSHGFTAAQGGAHEWTTKGALRCAEINEALFSLEVGQLSDVIESELGFHIIRVLERKEAGRKPFTEAQVEIREILEVEEKKDLVGVEMEKLRNKSRIWTIFDGDFRGSELDQLKGRTAQR